MMKLEIIEFIDYDGRSSFVVAEFSTPIIYKEVSKRCATKEEAVDDYKRRIYQTKKIIHPYEDK